MSVAQASGGGVPRYQMTISRLTIEKLGIKMYDKVSAVLSELIANSYDADAECVEIFLPFDTYLASKTSGAAVDLGYEVRVKDNGHGMTTQEVNDFYLRVGQNRRNRTSGDVSRDKRRKVMGRKGIGKLAPFGICREIEVITAGGIRTPEGYQVSNLILQQNEMFKETEENYFPIPGPLDGTFAPTTGTTIVLRDFERRRVPSGEDLHRQLAARFGIRRQDWEVKLINTLSPSQPIVLGSLPIDILEGTRIDVASRPIPFGDQALPISGWIAYSKDPYRDEVMAGVRLFARGKFVAQTRDFDVASGFTGEFKMRSYIVGELVADWLDEEEDLIRSDRQDIIWNSERGEALQLWGQELVKELAGRAETSIGRKVWDEFLEVSQLQDRLFKASPSDRQLRDSVLDAAKLLLKRTDREAIRDNTFVQNVVDLAFTIGPQRDLLRTLQEVGDKSADTLDMVVGLFNKARVVEMYSLGQVAKERIVAVERLIKLISNTTTEEMELQALLENAPWIIDPDWTPLSSNQSLQRVRAAFESWYQRKNGVTITTTTIQQPTKRPDFIMLNNEGCLEIIEIKKPGHALEDKEYDRAYRYLLSIEQFLSENRSLASSFPKVRLTLVCDELKVNVIYADQIKKDERVVVIPWQEVLSSTMRVHQDFLEAVRQMQGAEAEVAGTKAP